MSEDFTIYRGMSGRAVVMGPLCPHRLTCLSIGNVEGDSIRCQYHGWRFGPDGQCVEAPLQTQSLIERTAVKTYPTREEYGLIFAYLGDGQEPLFPDIAGYSRDHGRDLTSAPWMETNLYRRNCNYYLNVENSLDLAHVPYTHAMSSNPTITQVGFNPDLAIVRDFTVERFENSVKVAQIEQEGMATTEVTVLLPNVRHMIVGQRIGTLERLSWQIPINDEAHLSFSVAGRHSDEDGARRYAELKARTEHLAENYPATEECAEQILRGEKILRDFADHPKLPDIEDALTQQGMRFISDAGRQHFGQSDKGVVQLRRLFLSRLADFVAGDPSAVTGW